MTMGASVYMLDACLCSCIAMFITTIGKMAYLNLRYHVYI